MKGGNVPNFKINTSKGTSSNVFQILQDLRLKQYKGQYHSSTMHTDLEKVSSTMPKQYKGLYPSSTMPTTTSSVRRTVPFQYHAHSLGKTKHYGTAHGTTDNFFQDHHTLHSYAWKNDNRTDQSKYIQKLHVRHF